MRTWFGALVTASVLVASAAAHAQQQERVTLADGTVMQGELVEKVPGDHVTIKLATGEIRTIQWSAIVQPPPVVTQVAAPVVAPAGPSVHVMLDADHPGVTLVRVLGMGMVQAYTGYGTAYGAYEQTQPVCIAPCQADIDANGTYRIAGPGVTPTSTFGVPAQPGGALRLHVHAGSLGARVGGLWLLVGGGALAVVGGTLAHSRPPTAASRRTRACSRRVSWSAARASSRW